MIYTFSEFYYGYKVNAEPYNGYLDLDEGSGEISIEIPVGSYTLDGLVQQLRESLLAQGTLTYDVSVNRATRIITITADAPFEILSLTGTHFDSSIYSLIGFKTDSDHASNTTHVGILASGKSYYPQFKLQSYIGPDDWQESNQASVNVGSTGTIVEVVNFGLAKFIQFELKFITNKLTDGSVIKNNRRGVEDTRDFLQDITQKNYFEFMPDANDPDTYYKVLIESTADYQNGTGYKLKELFGKNLPDVYETGNIKLRVVE